MRYGKGEPLLPFPVPRSPTPPYPAMATALRLTSDAFAAGDRIPDRYTCNGDDVSPPLSWTGTPEGTRSLALVVDDPDAPRQTFVHWILFNLPPGTTALPQGVEVGDAFGDADPAPAEGVNDAGELGYTGPCPPVGHGVHHYWFRLYALDTVLDLGDGATRKDVAQAMDGHVLAEADLMGTYERTR